MKLSLFERKTNALEDEVIDDLSILKVKAERAAGGRKYEISSGMANTTSQVHVSLLPSVDLTSDESILPGFQVVRRDDGSERVTVFYDTETRTAESEEFSTMGEASKFFIEQIKFIQTTKRWAKKYG